MSVTKKVAERIQSGLKRFGPILAAQRDRDVSEADTVTLVKDILSEVFGYDKYTELTSEYAIRGTYCDLAIQFDGKVQLLIEVKAIGSPLQERHVKQAIDYACNKGVEWTVLTNGIEWVLYHVIFKKPIDKEEVVKLDLLEMDPRREEHLEKLYLLTRTGLSKDAHAEFHSRQEATNRFLLAAILLSEDVLKTVRREVRRVTDLLVDQEDVARVLREQVIKRETMEGDQAQAASRQVSRRSERSMRSSSEVEAPTAALPAGSAEVSPASPVMPRSS